MQHKTVGKYNFLAISSKLCGSYAFSQNFHTRKLGEITVFHAVLNIIQELGSWYTLMQILLKTEGTGSNFWLSGAT